MGQGGKGGGEGDRSVGGNSKSRIHLPIKRATDKKAMLYAAISKPTTWCRGVEEVAWGGGRGEVGRGAKRSEAGHEEVVTHMPMKGATKKVARLYEATTKPTTWSGA